jgi:Protein of unknown function (DUF998)
MNVRGLGRLTVYFGPAATLIYALFTVLAWLAYPIAYGPFNNNWLSDLGNRDVNPSGAEFYVIGCIATGVLVGASFVGLLAWSRSSTRVQRYLLTFVQIAGLLGAVAIVMTAVYTIDQFEVHQFWSRMINVGFAVALFVSPFALRRQGMKLWPLIAVSALGYCSIVARLVFPDAHWLEWPSIGFLLAYMWVIAVMTRAESSGLPMSRPALARPA